MDSGVTLKKKEKFAIHDQWLIFVLEHKGLEAVRRGPLLYYSLLLYQSFKLYWNHILLGLK